MRNILIILSILSVFVSCNGNSSKTDIEQSDNDNISVEVDTESNDEDVDRNVDELPDSDADSDDMKNCIPVEETGDILCFYPRPSDEPCSLPDEYGVDHILSRNAKGAANVSQVDLNKEFFFFMQTDTEYTHIMYRCNKKNGKVEKIRALEKKLENHIKLICIQLQHL